MFHEGPTQTALRNQNHLDRIIFHCCGGEQIGFSPVLYECPPCKVGRHVSAEEKEAQQKAAAKKVSQCLVFSHNVEHTPSVTNPREHYQGQRFQSFNFNLRV